MAAMHNVSQRSALAVTVLQVKSAANPLPSNRSHNTFDAHSPWQQKPSSLSSMGDANAAGLLRP